MRALGLSVLLFVFLVLTCSLGFAQSKVRQVVIAGHRDLVPGENDPYYTPNSSSFGNHSSPGMKKDGRLHVW